MGREIPDIRSEMLLHKLNELCTDGGFRIVEESELTACFAGKYGADGDDVRTMLEFLRAGGYIDMQYAEEGVYCVNPLPEGRRYAERLRDERLEEVRRRRLLLLCTAGSSFLGAFIGALIVLLVSLAL